MPESVGLALMIVDGLLRETQSVLKVDATNNPDLQEFVLRSAYLAAFTADLHEMVVQSTYLEALAAKIPISMEEQGPLRLEIISELGAMLGSGKIAAAEQRNRSARTINFPGIDSPQITFSLGSSATNKETESEKKDPEVPADSELSLNRKAGLRIFCEPGGE